MVSDEKSSSGSSDKQSGTAVVLAAASSVAAALTGQHLSGDFGLLVTSGGGPVLSWLWSSLQSTRFHKVERVIAGAQLQSGLTIEELVERILADDVHGELASRILLAAQDAGTEEHLRALSRSLVTGSLTTSAEDIGVEILFVRALVDLDSPHILVLESFDKTWSELGLFEDATLPPDGLNFGQIATATKLGAALSPVLGALSNHGLIEEVQQGVDGGNAAFGMLNGGGGRGQFLLTDFGHSMLSRMMTIGDAEDDASAGIPSQAAKAKSAVPQNSEGDENCAICRTPCFESEYANGPFASIPRSKENTDQTGVVNMVRIPLCLKHKETYYAKRVAIGWCVACGSFGEARRYCECGGHFDRVT